MRNIQNFEEKLCEQSQKSMNRFCGVNLKKLNGFFQRRNLTVTVTEGVLYRYVTRIKMRNIIYGIKTQDFKKKEY